MHLSEVEKAFTRDVNMNNRSTRIPYITVSNFPRLGLLTSLRFLEWVAENPEGVISLPTGKTPEYFIKFTNYLLDNWQEKKVDQLKEKYRLNINKKPDLRGLHFVQMDEFYPINPAQHNSFCNYVLNYYIRGFGLDINKALLINSDEIWLPEDKHYREVFPDFKIDLSLRYREPNTLLEEIQKASVFKIDQWCSVYEQKIREMGGIGFFLGGIGPDGHIAFNTAGSGHFSTTRLTQTNFPTQAVAASDLGGIEISRNRLVITIGLETIRYNPEAVAIIFAAGEAKGDIIKASLEHEPTNLYPATVLQHLPNSRFYLTTGATVKLTDTINAYYKTGSWNHEKTQRAVIDLCHKKDTYGEKLTIQDLQADPYCRLIPGLTENTVPAVIQAIKDKITKGSERETRQKFFHTGPHHDDIMLGMMPKINRQFRDSSNDFRFCIFTSGFNAVTNSFVIDYLDNLTDFLRTGQIQMIEYGNFFENGYQYKWNKDVYHYLNNVAADNVKEQKRGLCHRLVRSIVDIWNVTSRQELEHTIQQVREELINSYPGSKNPPNIRKLKGMIREFEEELVWAHSGVPVNSIQHMRLGFYQGDIFTEEPDVNRDVQPILKELKTGKPTVISLAFDPEGSGPDTHYKVLQALAEAIHQWSETEDVSGLTIIGYRNVWYRYHPAEVNRIVPVSLNSLAMLDEAFTNCYLSQVHAPFPSYLYDGKFSNLTQKIWIEQLNQIQLLLGKDFFYQNDLPLLRATHGLIYLKEMNVQEFMSHARTLKESIEGFVL